MKKTNRSINRADMFTFKRWGGKTYSLFNALKKPVRIGVLLAVYTCAVKSEYVYAQADNSKVSMEYDLNEVEVSAQRAPVAFSQVARIVSVISREEIEAAPVQSIQDLLEYALSVDIRQRGVYGVQADISIRGGSFDQTLILLNGINISDPQTGHHSLNLPVSLKSIDRIEILEGPAARVYGPNAFSGAINIITTAENDNKLRMDVSAGENGLYDLNVSGNMQTGKVSQFIAASKIASKGYIDNTDFNTYNLFYQGQLLNHSGKFDWQTGYTNKEFGGNSFYSATYPNEFEQTKTTFASLKYETGVKVHFRPSVYWRRHQDRFELFRDNPASWYAGHNYHLTDVFGSNLNVWFDTALGRTALGAEIRNENVWSNVLGNAMNDPIEVPGESGHFFTKSYSRTYLSYFIEHSVYLKHFSASIGAMANRISDLNFSWKIYPGIDMAWNFNDHFKIYGTINSNLRMPTFTDLFYSDPTSIGNPYLKPETAVTYESGLKYNSSAFRGHAGYFYRAGKNMIDWVRESEAEKFKAKNLAIVNASGFEASAEIFPGKLSKKATFIKKIGLNYSYTNLDYKDGNLLSKYVLDNLKHKLNIELEHKIWSRLGASWRATYQDRNGMRTQTESYKPFWLVNTRLMWKNNHSEIYVMAQNLFDTSYYDLGYTIQPGRWLSVGYKLDLNF